jgi:hypothetical protein
MCNLAKIFYLKPLPKDLKHMWDFDSQNENPLDSVEIHFFTFFCICVSALKFYDIIHLSCLGLGCKLKAMVMALVDYL